MPMPSSLHHHTPSLAAFDPRGLSVRRVAYHRTSSDAPALSRINSQVFSATGVLLEQWDPRLHRMRDQSPAPQSNQSTRYSLGGHPLFSRSVDAGSRWWLRGAAGHVLRSWDSRGAKQRQVFDPWLRLIARHERGADELAERCVEVLTYASVTSQDKTANRCGRLVRHEDASGSLRYEHYSLTGQVLSEQRRLCQSLHVVDWPQAVAERDARLKPEGFTTAWHYDVFAAVIGQIDAKGHCQHSVYGIDGLLLENALTLKGERRQVLIDQRTYNASGQLESERASNNVMTVAQYAQPDGRLERLQAYRAGEAKSPLQDLNYEYDRVGNVTRIRDNAQPVQWSFNAQVDPVSTFAYDTLYQLTYATGRENANNSPSPALPAFMLFGVKDDTVWRNYRHVYVYDEAGNLTQLRHHVKTGSGYRRTFAVASTSNHGVLHDDEAVTPQTPGLGSAFDRNGNPLSLGRGQALQWSVNNHLLSVTLVHRTDARNDEEAYTYDAAGQRVQKVRTTLAASRVHTRSVLYLPGLEIREDTATGEQLNVITVQTGLSGIRVLQWDRGRVDPEAQTQCRFSLADLSGSTTLELDGHGQLITQESYYPYGATAWWAARTALQATFKTVRYSGKEQDASGLYYYGFRYYAPWLQRWINPDPAGAIDGLNRFVMVGNNPISKTDRNGLIGAYADLRPTRVQALEHYVREHFPTVYLQPLETFMFRHSLSGGEHADVINALRTQGFSFEEMAKYNASVSISANRPANILQGLEQAYIASSSYFNEMARWMTNPLFNPVPGDWSTADIETIYSNMQPEGAVTFDPAESGMSDALSVTRERAVELFDLHIRSNPGASVVTAFRGTGVSDLGLKALIAQASTGDIVRTEQFLSVSSMMSVAKRFSLGSYDTRGGGLNPVMLTVKGARAMELPSPVNEAESIYPLQSTFTIKPAGFSQALVKAYAPSATHFVLQEVYVPPSKRQALPFMTDPHGFRW